MLLLSMTILNGLSYEYKVSKCLLVLRVNKIED